MIGTDDQLTFSPGFALWQFMTQASLTLRQLGKNLRCLLGFANR